MPHHHTYFPFAPRDASCVPSSTLYETNMKNSTPVMTTFYSIRPYQPTPRYHHEEQVSVIYSRDTFGNIAASAFTQAVKNMIGINVDFDAAGPQPATIEISSM